MGVHWSKGGGVLTARIAVLAVCLLCFPGPVGAQTGVTRTQLGTLGGSWSQALAISPLGHVVGDASTAGEAEYHPFLWTATAGMVDLGTLGGTQGQAVAVNASGNVAGTSRLAGDQASHAFLWTPQGGMVGLGALSPGGDSAAVAINASGHVAGNSVAPGSSIYRAFLWTPADGMVDLGTLGGQQAVVTGLNDAGQVIGYSNTAIGEVHAFVWTLAGGMVDLGTFGGNESLAFAQNAGGHVVGAALAPGNTIESIRAFRWTPSGGMVDLGDFGAGFSQAAAINTGGMVVGNARYVGPTGQVVERGFSWTESGGLVDLGTLGGDRSAANDVNVSGIVAGSACVAGENPCYPVVWASTGHIIILDDEGGVHRINDAGQIIGSRSNQAVMWTLPVATPTALLAELRTHLDELQLDRGTRNALFSSLRAAERLLDSGKPRPAAQVLRAFIATVTALPSKKLPPSHGHALVSKAREIIALLDQ